ncbi:hypothetical protein T459_02947 [Capsicum annuum]|uniref:Acylphosphatase-like domain-containing protein n=1 Tax=Capsicum annuum TaxID=4072 RepID=A0A2G3ALE6_CAPAN|nr:hypothetical protein T459_02947 [Capsicum annuum]
MKVLSSKTEIALVNSTFLPRLENEREICARTIYCTNIYKKVTQANVKLFSSTFVESLRLLDDYHHSTRIGFVEFVMVRAVIKERVQGVFCSDWTVENAKELVLKGWV